jgi:hypothetical protein
MRGNRAVHREKTKTQRRASSRSLRHIRAERHGWLRFSCQLAKQSFAWKPEAVQPLSPSHSRFGEWHSSVAAASPAIALEGFWPGIGLHIGCIPAGSLPLEIARIVVEFRRLCSARGAKLNHGRAGAMRRITTWRKWLRNGRRSLHVELRAEEPYGVLRSDVDVVGV